MACGEETLGLPCAPPHDRGEITLPIFSTKGSRAGKRGRLGPGATPGFVLLKTASTQRTQEGKRDALTQRPSSHIASRPSECAAVVVEKRWWRPSGNGEERRGEEKRKGERGMCRRRRASRTYTRVMHPQALVSPRVRVLRHDGVSQLILQRKRSLIYYKVFRRATSVLLSTSPRTMCQTAIPHFIERSQCTCVSFRSTLCFIL